MTRDLQLQIASSDVCAELISKVIWDVSAVFLIAIFHVFWRKKILLQII